MSVSNSATAATGRFAAQMLNTFGVQRTVRTVQGYVANTFRYATGENVYQSPVSATNALVSGFMEVGYCSPNDYDRGRCHYISRGASDAYADTMCMVSLDISRLLDISMIQLLEQSEVSGKLDFSDLAYYEYNKLRALGNQVTVTNAIDNRKSLQSRQIRA